MKRNERDGKMKFGAIGTETLIPALIILFLLAIIPARIASKKGYSFAGFYVFGLFLFVIALVVSLLMKDKAENNPTNLLVYKQLLDSGAITQEEFDKKKIELMK